MPRRFLLRLSLMQPSQLYLSEAKLAHVMARWWPRRPGTLSPIPVRLLDGIIVSTDGHTRAFAAYRERFAEVPVYWDEDKLDWEAYRVCVAWCRAEGIRTIRDLEGRIVSPETYTTCWLERCRAMQEALAVRRHVDDEGS